LGHDDCVSDSLRLRLRSSWPRTMTGWAWRARGTPRPEALGHDDCNFDSLRLRLRSWRRRGVLGGRKQAAQAIGLHADPQRPGARGQDFTGRHALRLADVLRLRVDDFLELGATHLAEVDRERRRVEQGLEARR